MRKVNAFLLSSVFLLTDSCPGLSPCFAGMYALVPRVLKSCVTSTSAVFEPGTPESTATHFPRFPDGAAFGAYRTDCRRRRSCWVFVGQTQKEKKHYNMYCVHDGLLHVTSLGLTFAGLRALRPPVVYVFVCSTAAVLVPSTARGTATDSAGFPKPPALWTRHRTKNR